MNATWSILTFNELRTQDLHDILKLRVDVFVVEQRCVYDEVDGKDTSALHVIARNDGGSLVAYARILPPHGDEPPHIGRVVVAQRERGTGLARTAMLKAIEEIEQRFGTKRSALAAQNHLEGFYRKLGYVRQGPDYDWDGIPHVDMLRDP